MPAMRLGLKKQEHCYDPNVASLATHSSSSVEMADWANEIILRPNASLGATFTLLSPKGLTRELLATSVIGTSVGN
jgi:hypothetical protein